MKKELTDIEKLKKAGFPIGTKLHLRSHGECGGDKEVDVMPSTEEMMAWIDEHVEGLKFFKSAGDTWNIAPDVDMGQRFKEVSSEYGLTDACIQAIYQIGRKK
jgi:hypothetical protein